MSPFQPYSLDDGLIIDNETKQPVAGRSTAIVEKRPTGRPKGSRSIGTSKEIVKYRLLSDRQKDAIRERLRFGETIPDIAAAYEAPISQILDVAKSVVAVDPGAVTGGRFQKTYRVELIDEFADAIWSALHDTEKPPTSNDLRNLSISLGVIFDKRRLEEGLSTSNTESHTTVRKGWSRRAAPTKGKK